MKKWANALRKLYTALKSAYNFLTPEQRAILLAQVLLIIKEARAMAAQAKKTKAVTTRASRMLPRKRGRKGGRR